MWTLTEEAHTCSELYVYVDMKLSAATALNVCVNAGNAQGAYTSFSSNTTFKTATVVANTKAATINELSISRRIFAASKNASGTINTIGVRPNSNTITMTGSLEIWGWV